MANFQCDIPCIVCDPPIVVGQGLAPNDPNNPFLNLSSELPDIDLFIGRRYTIGLPPLGQFFYAVGCIGICFSEESQEDAELCAARQNVLCNSSNWPISIPNPEFPGSPNNPQPPTIPRPRITYLNTSQSAQFVCPNGTVFTYTTPAGTFRALSQVAANAKALSDAQNKAISHRICLGPLSETRVCLGSVSGLQLAVETNFGPCEFTVVAENLPVGISVADDGTNFFLIGDFTTAGDWTFTLLVLDQLGNEQTGAYSFTVLGITNGTALTDAEVGTAYSEQLNVAGTLDGTPQFTIVSGALPDGLTLNASTGLISGTPTTEQDSSFTVQVADESLTCQKAFTIEVLSAACADVPESGIWTPNTFADAGCTSTSTPVGNTVNLTGTTPIFSSFAETKNADAQAVNAVNYEGPELQCCISGTFDGTLPTSGVDFATTTIFIIQITHDGNLILDVPGVFGTGAPLPFNYPFTIPNTPAPVAMTYLVLISQFGDSNNFVSCPATSIVLDATIGNCP
jgi:hypothetical protein